jgi:rhodanese-related sulfurtransferase
MIVGFVGFISAGKDTAADFLVNSHGFRRDSFANTLKDAVANVFGWDRTLLEGRTAEAREWREQVDEWWAQRLNMPKLTPRWVLQYWGTEVCRKGFHDDIWIASVENKMRKTGDNIVISDVRFPNEIQSIHNAGGIVVRIKRGDDPEWYDAAESMNKGPEGNATWSLSKNKLEQLKIHASETAWVGGDIDHVVLNNTTIDELYSQIENLLPNKDLPFSTKIALDLLG